MPPQNQASPLFSVVPVLPHWPSAPIWALVPVPLETTVSRMPFASSAVPCLMTWSCSRVVVAALDRLAVLVGHLGVGDRAVAGPRGEGAADPVAVVADRRVGVGPAERRDALLEAAEHHRRVGRDRVVVAGLVDRAGDRAGPVLDRLALQPFEAELGVDRVVGVGRRADDRAGAEVGVLVVVDFEGFLAVACRSGRSCGAEA